MNNGIVASQMRPAPPDEGGVVVEVDPIYYVLNKERSSVQQSSRYYPAAIKVGSSLEEIGNVGQAFDPDPLRKNYPVDTSIVFTLSQTYENQPFIFISGRTTGIFYADLTDYLSGDTVVDIEMVCRRKTDNLFDVTLLVLTNQPRIIYIRYRDVDIYSQLYYGGDKAPVYQWGSWSLSSVPVNIRYMSLSDDRRCAVLGIDSTSHNEIVAVYIDEYSVWNYRQSWSTTGTSTKEHFVFFPQDSYTQESQYHFQVLTTRGSRVYIKQLNMTKYNTSLTDLSSQYLINFPSQLGAVSISPTGEYYTYFEVAREDAHTVVMGYLEPSTQTFLNSYSTDHDPAYLNEYFGTVMWAPTEPKAWIHNTGNSGEMVHLSLSDDELTSSIRYIGDYGAYYKVGSIHKVPLGPEIIMGD